MLQCLRVTNLPFVFVSLKQPRETVVTVAKRCSNVKLWGKSPHNIFVELRNPLIKALFMKLTGMDSKIVFIFLFIYIQVIIKIAGN